MRYVPLIIFAIVLAAPLALRWALLRNRASQVHGAGAERLVVITPHTSDIRNEFGRAFSAWHRARYGSDVEIDFRIPGGSTDVKRQLEATYRADLDGDGRLPADTVADISIVWGGGDFFMEQLKGLFTDRENKKFGILQPLQMPPPLLEEFRAAFPDPALAGVKLYDDAKTGGQPTPRWIGVCLSSFGICYNPDVYGALQLPPPRAWHDLTDSKLAGFLALADPAHSGSSAVAYQMVIQRQMDEAETRYCQDRGRAKPPDAAARLCALAKDPAYQEAIGAGWKQGMAELVKIAANARYFTDSSTLVPMDVSRGEAAAGMAIDFYARVTEETVGENRLQFVAPVDATAITPDPVAVLYGTRGRKLVLAEHFIEFLLSREAQLLWVLKPGAPGGPGERGLWRMPIRRDVYDGDRTHWVHIGHPFEVARAFNQRGDWMALFNDSRPIWVAAWIDSRDGLRDAYGAILKVADPARRKALIDDLADLPIGMSDVQAAQKERIGLEQSHADMDLWRATQQIAWAARFRTHYRTVQQAAR